MKKFICVMFIVILTLGLCACYSTTNENDEKVKGIGNYVVIETSDKSWLTYDKNSLICYDINVPYSNSRTIVPHMTVENGVVYYTLYDNGTFKLAPMGIVSTDSIDSWFNRG